MQFIKFTFEGDDKVTPVANKIFKNADQQAKQFGNRFRDVFENVTQNATGSFGSIAGGLFKLPGPAGIAAASILAIGGAAVASAKRYAEANAANDTASAQFLATLDKLKTVASDVADFFGRISVNAINAFAEATGNAATQQEILAAKTKALNSEVLKQNDEFSKLVQNAIDTDKAFKNQDKLIAVRSFSLAIGDLEKKRLTASDAEKKDLNAQIALYRQKIILIGESAKPQVEKVKKVAQLDFSKIEADSQKKHLAEVDTARKAYLDGRALREKALAENQARRDVTEKAIIENNALARRTADEAALAALNRQREAALRIGEAIRIGFVNSLENALAVAKDLNSFMQAILSSFLRAGISFGLNALTGGIGGALGGLFGIPSAAAGNANIPIPTASRAARAPAPALAPTSAASSSSMVNLNFTSPVIDINFVRNRLVPMLRELSRNGVKIA